MTRDPVDRAFLKSAALDAERAVAASDVLQLAAESALVLESGPGDPPSAYRGLFRGVEHFERGDDGTVRVTDEPVPFRIEFGADYLVSTDPSLQFRVVRVDPRLFHPNHKGGVVCLGPAFAAGTRLRTLLEQVYGIVSARVYATDHGLEPSAVQYFIQHTNDVRALRSPPLWRRPVAAAVRVEKIPNRPEDEDTPHEPSG